MSTPTLSPPALELVSHCQGIIRRGSASFSLAARLFPSDLRAAASMLYFWCRHCDDEIDGMRSGHSALAFLENSTRWAYDQSRCDSLEPAFRSLGEVVRRFSIPMQYPLDLLEGMRMDVNHRPYDSLRDLRRYCYHVAGTVGLMMTYIVGASSDRALPHAVEMGIAMQFTNIARDIKEDLACGRIYLPTAWLSEAGIDISTLRTEDLADRTIRDKLFLVTVRLLEAAEKSYDFAFQGLAYLPIRGVFAVSVAGAIYREIGRRLLAQGPDGLLTRAVVPLPRKLLLIAHGIAVCVPIAFTRLTRRWTRTELPAVWEFK